MKQDANNGADVDTARAGCACCAAAQSDADAGRRTTLKTIATIALVGAGVRPALAADDGPRKGDLLVKVDDESKTPLRAADLKVGEKQIIAWPYDPAAKASRDGNRLNRIAVLKLDPATMDEATKARSADGVVAYSAFCTHQGCDVSAWVEKDKAMLCFCHFSKFDPAKEAAVIGGPAPRPQPALPLALDDGKLVVAGGFTAAPGKAA